MWSLLPLLCSVALAQEPAPAPEEPAAGEELPIVAMPSILEYVEAPYPEEAKELGLSAVVKLRITLTETGEIDAVDVVEPQGHGFDEAAVDAVLSMTWAPAKTEAGPVGVVFEFDYGFVLEPPPPPPDPEPAVLPVNVSGVVIEMATREPLADVQIGVTGTDLATTTDAEGRFELR
ncbi:MAG: TonB family protein, partial [Myxococcales bacterium]|nr:TonB family protein [Myxococcales bacterium]